MKNKKKKRIYIIMPNTQETLAQILKFLEQIAQLSASLPGGVTGSPFNTDPNAPVPNAPGSTGKTIAENLADAQAVQAKLTKIQAAASADLENLQTQFNTYILPLSQNPWTAMLAQPMVKANNDAQLADNVILHQGTTLQTRLSNWVVNAHAGQPLGEGTSAGPLPVLTPELEAYFEKLLA